MLNKILNRSPQPSALLINTEEDDRQRTLNELLKAQSRLRALYDSSFDALMMLDNEGFIDGNSAALTLFGCINVIELCRYHPSDLSPAKQACGTDSTLLAQHYIDLALKEGSCRFEWQHQRADNGVVFEVEVLMSSLEVDGKIVLQCVLHDLTERRQADALLANKEKEAETLRLALYEQTLQQELNSRTRKVFENIPGAVFEFCLSTKGQVSVTFASAGIASIYELNAQQVKDDASALFGRIHADDLDKVMASIQESAHSLQAWHMEYRVNLPEKGLRWLLGISNPVKQDDGSIIWYGLNSDITARKQREAALIQSNILQEATFNSAIFSSIATDAQGVIQIFNVGAENMLGYAASEVVNRMTPAYFSDVQELTTRADALSVQYGVSIAPGFESLAYKSSREIHDIYELTYIHKNGKRIPALVSITALRDHADIIIGYLLIATDNTEQKAAKLQLNTLSLAIEQSSSVVMITDLTPNVEYINQAFINSSGYAREEIIGKNPGLFKSGKTPKSTYEVMWASLQDGKAWQGELINQNKQGEDFIELTWITPIRQDNQTISHYLSVKENITERKRSEALLVAAKERAENLASSKSQFLANMSHEIRTPMSAIIGFSDLALLEEMPVAVYDYLQDISTASRHLLTILNDILDISKLEAGQMTLQLESFNLADLRSTLYGLLINTARAKGLSFTIEIDDKVPNTLIGDALRLRQVLINLLGNAIKFTQQGSVTLTITLQQINATDAQLLFSVIDTGMGISAEQQDKLFQPFSQVDDSFSRNFEGTGLGLTISQNLVQLMGAGIKLNSDIGLGSCFSFELSLPLDLSISEPQLVSTIILNPEPLGGVRILVVEDDAFNQKIINLVLHRFGAYVVLANNGLEALSTLEQERFDIVLMDLHMPVMNGYDATLAIRKQARYAKLPVITLSASVTEDERRRCLATGMNDFIAKPINKIELLATLERWLKPLPG
jgi:PAS domain S-box-containing protein